MRGPNIVDGYWNKPEATAAAFTDGWFHTGDLGRQDDEGFVYIVDRLKDVVIRGGENVYSAEVEAVLFEHPAVLDVAIVGLPHEHYGEEVAAVVNLRDGATVDRRGAAGVRGRRSWPASRCRRRCSCAPSRCRGRPPARSSSATSATS